jgi:hypothetical protein
MVTLRRTPIWALVIYALAALALGYAVVAVVVAAFWIARGDVVGFYVEPSWGALLWFAILHLAVATYAVRRRRGDQ